MYYIKNMDNSIEKSMQQGKKDIDDLIAMVLEYIKVQKEIMRIKEDLEKLLEHKKYMDSETELVSIVRYYNGRKLEDTKYVKCSRCEKIYSIQALYDKNMKFCSRCGKKIKKPS